MQYQWIVIQAFGLPFLPGMDECCHYNVVVKIQMLNEHVRNITVQISHQRPLLQLSKDKPSALSYPAWGAAALRHGAIRLQV
jgi:hypothetical protein